MLTDAEIISSSWFNLSKKQLTNELIHIIEFNKRAEKSKFYSIKPNKDAELNIIRAINLKQNQQLKLF